MLTSQQLSHFDTFGFLFLPRAFAAEEMTAFIRAAEEVWEEGQEPEEDGERRLGYFVERRPLLTRLVLDECIYPAIEALMGPNFIWIGSEGNISTPHRSQLASRPQVLPQRRGTVHRLSAGQSDDIPRKGDEGTPAACA